MKYKLIILLVCAANVVYGQASEDEVNDRTCVSKSDCGSCLKAGGLCAFCEDENFASKDRNVPRCDSVDNLKTRNCTKIMNKQSFEKSKESNPFSPTNQIQPKKITLSLRPGQTHKFELKIEPARDFPAHLYYLMDMSRSMYDDQQNLQTLGVKIANNIAEVTKNYKLAFGTFVDKTVAPFIEIGKIDKPCVLSNNISCEKTFGYRHVFDFNSDGSEFENAVKQQQISGNYDTPEGGFDALMQVAMCTTNLKWQSVELARRIVVFVTDAAPHIGGDGKIGGITKPHDGQCHLNRVNSYYEYSKSNDMDYPSLSLLKDTLEKNDIIPILAVTEDVKYLYDKIVEDWSDFKAAIGTLDKDSGNIVSLIRNSYDDIITTLKPTSKKTPDDVIVKFRAKKCDAPAEVLKDGTVCAKIDNKEGKYSFDVSVTALKCPKDSNTPRTFTIDTGGFGKTEVTIEMMCECDCEKEAGVVNSPKCSSEGRLRCGICECNEGRIGNQCECEDTKEADDHLCKQTNDTDIVCSGHGTCQCGKCFCNKRNVPGQIISGKFCECNNFGCDRYEGKLCGGPSRGVCECGKCKCKEKYTGGNCGQTNCTFAAPDCRSGTTDEICSGHGKCDCGDCVCEKGYGGLLCETCVTCQSKCSQYKECVRCHGWGEGIYADNDCKECADFNYQIVNYTLDATCEFYEDGCWFYFKIDSDEKSSGNNTILIQKEKRCILVVPKETPILAIVLGIIGGLILLALILLLLWKLLITAYDNYEYQKFLKENQNPNWANTNNPIYKPSQTNYQNPTYAGK